MSFFFFFINGRWDWVACFPVAMENDPKVDDNSEPLGSSAECVSATWDHLPVSPRQPEWRRFPPLWSRPATGGWCRPPQEPAPLWNHTQTHIHLIKKSYIDFAVNTLHVSSHEKSLRVDSKPIHSAFYYVPCGFQVKYSDSKLTVPLNDRLHDDEVVKWQTVKEHKFRLEHFNWPSSNASSCIFQNLICACSFISTIERMI